MNGYNAESERKHWVEMVMDLVCLWMLLCVSFPVKSLGTYRRLRPQTFTPGR